MEQRLTQEQIEKARKLLREQGWNGYASMVSESDLDRLASVLQYAPPQYDEDVVRSMVLAGNKARGQVPAEEINKRQLVEMSAALGVVLDRVDQVFEDIFRHACVGCHNAAVNPVNSLRPKASLFGDKWGHASELNTRGYHDCTAGRLRNIVITFRASLLKPAKPTMAEEITRVLERAGIDPCPAIRAAQEIEQLITRHTGGQHD
jgi:hypothetical protein